MNRRRAISGLLAFFAMVGPSRAQVQRGTPFRVVTLPDLFPERRAWFSEDMRNLGWTEARDFVIVESRLQYGEWEPLADAARRIAANKPDVVLVTSTAYAVALHRVTATVPIVMHTSGYPVEAGLADGLARPGKNVTGNTVYAGAQVWGKLLQLLRETKPGINRISVLWTYVPPPFLRAEIEPGQAELRNASHLLGLKVHIVEAGKAQVTAALAEIEAEHPDALLLTSGLPYDVRPTVMQFAVTKRLPMIADAEWVSTFEPYPLLSYGAVLRELMRSSATYVHQILKGAKPGDLPIQQPAKYQLAINLKTAKAIGLTIPHELLLRADRVIE